MVRQQSISIPTGVTLSIENFLESLANKLFHIPFDNEDDESIYAVSVELDGPGIVVEMSDGSTFTIEVRKI